MRFDLVFIIRQLFFGDMNIRASATVRRAVVLFVAALLIGTFGYMIIEGYRFIEAFYMTVITISTVGFTEVEPLSRMGRLFTSFLILANIGIFAYALYAFTDHVIEGEVFKKLKISYMNHLIEDLEEHIIICGYGRYGQEISEHFTQDGFPFVVIDLSEERLGELLKIDKRHLFVRGDASQDDVLIQAGIKKAKHLIVALSDDTDNVFTVLTARQLNSDINIISRASNPRTQRKLKLAGANRTIMPEQIGGFYMAALVTKPGAVDFFSFVTNEYESDIGFEEINFEDVPLECQCRTIAELNIRSATGCNIIGYKSPNSRYIVNPPPDTSLVFGSSFIVLGSDEQLGNLESYWKEFAQKNKSEHANT
ncbi:MAG: NAD-binding protein [Bacteroidota bacterium]